MSVPARRKSLAACAALLAATVFLSLATVWGFLASDVPEEPAAGDMEASGRPVGVSVGDAFLEAGFFRMDPLLRQPHLLREVLVTRPGYTMSAESATIVPGGKSLVMNKAAIASKGLEARMDTLILRGNRVVFENVKAQGTICPFEVERFEAGRVSLPESSLEEKRDGLGRLVDGVGRKAGGHREGPAAITFGFGRLEIVATLLFQRGYMREGFAELSDGKTRVSFRRGTYTARHRKVYATDALVVGEGLRLEAKDAEVLMDRGDFVLLPPVDRMIGTAAEKIDQRVSFPLK